MPRCLVDSTIERVTINGFAFPLGVYPVEPLTPVPGYTLDFEPSDGDDNDGEWEEWPDRYVFDVVVSADRLESLLRGLFGLFPGRVYPILDVLGRDAYREIDPYIAYDMVGLDRFLDAFRRYRGFFLESGLSGFGLLSDDPFVYVFVDEHKIVTIRVQADMKERVEKILAAFDLEHKDEPAGVDSAQHEHREVLVAPDDRPDLLNFDEIVEQLRDDLRLTLNIDPERNLDDDDNELGVTAWRGIIRAHKDEEDKNGRYAELILTAANLRDTESIVEQGMETLLPPGVSEWAFLMIVAMDRLEPPEAAEHLGDSAIIADLKKDPQPESRIYRATWLE